MMKQANSSYEQFTSFENLYIAWKKARKGKRKIVAVMQFEQQLEEQLLALQYRLRQGIFEFSPYRSFTLYEPVERLVCAAPFPDRVVHHAMMNLLEPLMEQRLIPHTYACRKDKGTHVALHVLQRKLKKAQWILKLDLKKYFFTIDHQILLDQLSTDFDLPEAFVSLIQQLLASYKSDSRFYFPQPSDDLFDAVRPRGLPIGNLTSQWLANYYLNALDHFLNSHPCVQHYQRYMDDMVVLSATKTEAKRLKAEVRTQLLPLRLTLNERKSQLFPVKQGLAYLGHHIWADRRRILRPNLKRFRKRMKEKASAFEAGDLCLDDLRASVNGWTGFIQKPGYAVSNQVFDYIYFRPEEGLRFRYILS